MHSPCLPFLFPDDVIQCDGDASFTKLSQCCIDNYTIDFFALITSCCIHICVFSLKLRFKVMYDVRSFERFNVHVLDAGILLVLPYLMFKPEMCIFFLSVFWTDEG